MEISGPNNGSPNTSTANAAAATSSNAARSVSAEAQNLTQQMQNQREASRRQQVAPPKANSESDSRNQFSNGQDLDNQVAREISRRLSSEESSTKEVKADTQSVNPSGVEAPEAKGSDGAPESDFQV